MASPAAVLDLVRRQLPCADIASYFKLVNTALFAVNYVNSFSHPCDTSLIPYFDSQGLNGRYAVDIICLYDAGIHLFDEPLETINDNLIVTLIGLFDAFGPINDPSRNLSCSNVNTKILEELELDSAAIKSIICDFKPCTTGSVDGTTSSTAVISSTSSCSSGSASTAPPSRSASSTDASSSMMSSLPSRSATSSVSTGATSNSSGITSTRPICTGTPPSSSNAGGSMSTVISKSTASTSNISTTSGSNSSGGSSVQTSSVTSRISTSSIPVVPPSMTY